MTIKETVLPLADAQANAVHPLDIRQARAALCAALDAADKDKEQSEYIIAEAAGDVDRLEAENAALRLDAERYRYLKQCRTTDPEQGVDVFFGIGKFDEWGVEHLYESAADAAIDAARAALEK
jgi:hypothetical protein